MTGLELGEIQVSRAVPFSLGLAVGFPLSGGKHIRAIESCFGETLFFWFSVFNVCCFTAGLEKAGEQKWGAEVGRGPPLSEANFCASQARLRPWPLGSSAPLPLWPARAPGQDSPLSCHVGFAKALPPSAAERPPHLVSLLPRGLGTRGPAPGPAPPPRPGCRAQPLSRCPGVSRPSAPPAPRARR